MAIQWIIKSRACARALLFTGLLRYARNDKKVVCAGAQEFYDLGPVVKPRDDKKRELCSAGPGPRDDKKRTWGPGTGMTGF